MPIRVRLSFDELVPGYSQKTWFLFDTTSCRLVADLEHLIQRKFRLPKNSSVNLYIEGFLLPAQEKIEIVRDGDIIRVEQAYFSKEKGKAKWSGKDDLDSDVKPSKKQKLDAKSQTSVDIQVKKNKSNNMTNNKNQGRKPETKPINGTDSNSHEKLRSGKVKVEKPCKGNDMSVQKEKNKAIERAQDKGLPTEQKSSNDSPTVRKRTLPSSSSSSSSSSSEDDILGEVNRDAKRTKIGNSLKRNEIGNSSSSSLSSSSTSCSSTSDLTSSSLSSEDSSDDTLSFSSSSSSSMLSSSSSEDSSDDNQKKGLNLKTKDKGSNKNTKIKAKVYPARNISSAKRQSKNVKNPSDPSNQSKKDGLISKEKAKDLDKKGKSKATVYESSNRQDENIRNQSKASNQSKKDGLNLKEEKDLDKNTKSKATVFKSSKREDENSRNQSKTSNQSKKDELNSKIEEKATDKNTKSKSTIVSSFKDNTRNQPKVAQPEVWNTHLIKPKSEINTPPQNISNNHIRFDSDEENQDNSACTENVDSGMTQDQGNDFYNAAANGSNTTQGDAQEDSQMPSHNDVHSLNNDGVNRNGNKKMDGSMGHAATTKKTSVDYSALPSLCGPPRAGDRIAYKVLELSASYTPEMSDYKEGSVLGYNPVKNEVLLELTEDSLMKPLGDGTISTKFELIYEDEEEENIEAKPPVIVDRKVSVPWTSMVDPRLIPGLPPGDAVTLPIWAV